jgi:hypothetical protein
MHGEDSLPPIFAQYAPLVRYVRSTGTNRWNSTCPACGGEPHGSEHDKSMWPDRCVWWDDAKPLGWCHQCQRTFFPDQAPGWEPPSAAELEEMRQRRVREAEEQRHKAERQIAFFQSEQVWLRYHEALDTAGRRYWERRGFAGCWIDFWRFGWCATREYPQPDGSVFITPSATIPIFGLEWAPLNVKHRLVIVPPNRGKYLYEVSGVGQPLFLCDPERELSGQVVVIEGELKAALVFARLDGGGMTIVGLPGLTPRADLLAQIGTAERVILNLDPGADVRSDPSRPSALERMIELLGRKRVRLLRLPCKIDDGILAADMGPREIKAMLNSASPA